MSNKKNCPFLSSPIRVDIGCGNFRYELMKNPCMKNECIAWEVKEYASGYISFCKLIEGGNRV